MLISCLLGLALARRGSGGGGSRPSGGSSRPSGGSSRPSGPSISSRPSRPSKTSTRGTSYRPMPYSSSTMSKSWSRRAVSAAAVILLAKQGRRRRGRIYNGWGYDVDDDEWYQNEMWEDLNSCFTCDSFDGSDTNCERLDSSIRIQDLSYQACPANSYCLLAMGTMENENETANRTWLTVSVLASVSNWYTSIFPVETMCSN